MIILFILLPLLSNAVTLRRDKYRLYGWVSTTVLFYYSLLVFRVNITYLNIGQVILILIFLSSALIKLPLVFHTKQGWTGARLCLYEGFMNFGIGPSISSGILRSSIILNYIFSFDLSCLATYIYLLLSFSL